MHNPVAFAKSQISEMITKAFGHAVADGSFADTDIPAFTVEMPNETIYGDFATNAAMVCARALKMPPRAIAEILAAHIKLTPLFNRVDIAGPGFINFFLSDAYYCDTVAHILKTGADYGRTDYGQHKTVMVEFVSANPTGPMHLGNARGGALGDCIASVLHAAGYDVTREFYINDAGNQIEKFGMSLEARYLQLFQENVIFPEDGYHGDDIKMRAKAFADLNGNAYVDVPSDERKAALVSFSLPQNITDMQTVLRDYRIDYDVWFYESTLHGDGTVQQVMDRLTERGCTYKQDEALWYKATAFGAEKDEVLVKSNGFFTYFAVDVAYHYNKFVQRGFDEVIDVWGADHHGHVARMKGAMEALGIGGDRLDVVLMQLVNLVRDGEPVRMSKRTGKAITLTDLLEEVPVDAARFYFVMREYNSHFDFDLGLAVKKDKENPVYYVQYAHARICSIIRELAAQGILPAGADECDFTVLNTDCERGLIRKLAMFPSEIITSAREREPARITRYTVDLATAFHKFYQECRVLCDDETLCKARTSLCMATRQVIQNSLTLLKIEAPDRM